MPVPPDRMDHAVPTAPGDFDLTMDELREITRYVAGSAAQVQDIFQRAHPEDPRVGAAIDAAWEFIRGGPRNRRQRNASLEAHRAAKDASTEAARLAARAAADAASAAYLHPLARAHQVAHILRAAACAARIAELTADDDPAAGASAIEDATARATPVLIEVLSRYPAPPAGKNRVDQLMSALDTSLRAHRIPDPARGGNGPSGRSRPSDTGRAVEAEARCERVVHTPASNAQPAVAARAAAGRPVRGKVPGREHQECPP